jgi:hypothetical protein
MTNHREPRRPQPHATNIPPDEMALNCRQGGGSLARVAATSMAVFMRVLPVG